MKNVLVQAMQVSLSAAGLILAVAGVRLLGRRIGISKRAILWLWVAVGLRLLIPVSIVSPNGVMPTIRTERTQAGEEPGRSASPAQDDSTAVHGNDWAAAVPKEPVTAVEPAPVGKSQTVPEPGAQSAYAKPDRQNAAAVPPVEEEKSESFPWESLLIIGYGAGVMGMLGYYVVRYLALSRRLKESQTPLEDNVFVSQHIKTAFVFGIIRPRVYLPADLDPTYKDVVLCHEFAHISHGDQAFKTLAFALLSLHWFNPFVWLAYFLFVQDMEYACDERVIRNMSPEGRKKYSEALLCLSTGRTFSAAVPVAFGEKKVVGRIRAVCRYRKPALVLSVLAVALSLILGACFFTNHETKEDVLPSESAGSVPAASEPASSDTNETPAESGAETSEDTGSEPGSTDTKETPAESGAETSEDTSPEPAPYKPLPVVSGEKTYEDPHLVRFTNFSVLIPDIPEITYVRIRKNALSIECGTAESAIEVFWTADASAQDPGVVRLVSEGNAAVCLRLADYAEQWFRETGYRADEMVGWFRDHVWIETENRGQPSGLFSFMRSLCEPGTEAQITLLENGQKRTYGWFTREDGTERPETITFVIRQIPVPGFTVWRRAYPAEGVIEVPRGERSLTIEGNGASFTVYENSRLLSFRENETAPVQYYWAEVGEISEFRMTGRRQTGDYGQAYLFGLFKRALDFIEYDELFYPAGIVTVADRGQSNEEVIREFEELLNERIKTHQLSPENCLFVSPQEQGVEPAEPLPKEHGEPLKVRVVLRFSLTHFDIYHAGQYMSLEEMGRLERREGVYGTYAIHLSGVITLEKGVYVLKMRVDTGDGGLGESLGYFGLEYLPRAEE